MLWAGELAVYQAETCEQVWCTTFGERNLDLKVLRFSADAQHLSFTHFNGAIYIATVATGGLDTVKVTIGDADLSYAHVLGLGDSRSYIYTYGLTDGRLCVAVQRGALKAVQVFEGHLGAVVFVEMRLAADCLHILSIDESGTMLQWTLAQSLEGTNWSSSVFSPFFSRARSGRIRSADCCAASCDQPRGRGARQTVSRCGVRTRAGFAVPFRHQLGPQASLQACAIQGKPIHTCQGAVFRGSRQRLPQTKSRSRVLRRSI